MMKIIKLILAITIFLIIFVTINIYGQLPINSTVTDINKNIYINYDGWQIPGLAQSSIKEQKEIITGIEFKGAASQKQKKKFNQTTFNIPEKTDIGADLYNAYRTRYPKASYHLGIRELTAYAVDGKIFCYCVTVHPESEYGCIGIIYECCYIDDDGDGKFEKFTFNFIPPPPPWAMELLFSEPH